MGRMAPAVSTAAVSVAVAAVALAGCTDARTSPATPPRGTTASPSTTAPLSSPAPTTAAPEASATTSTPASRPVPSFDAAAAVADVRLLAGEIGPRLATSASYRRAGTLVGRRLRALGYTVRLERFPVPAGDSWGVPVAAGTSFNVVAEPPGFRPARPHVVVGAHLDTVAVAPGAEDNASGVAVLLELARLSVDGPTRVPVVLVAFGAEEPRGPGDDLHHFGSQQHVRELTAARRRAIRAMVALDRVGVGGSVPVCTGPLSPARVQRELLRTARRAGIRAHSCENTASDHWSFEKAGVTVARLGSTSYAAYHSPDDLPSVVRRDQLDRVGRLMWAWLR